MTTVSAFRASRAIGAMFFALLGGCWLFLWSNRISGPRSMIHIFIAIGALGIFGMAWRTYRRNREGLAESADSPVKKRADRVFNIVNAGQWILIFVVYNVLVNKGHEEWGLPAAIFIIGLHFLPLAHIFHYSPHYITGSALMLWSIGYSLIATNGPANPVGCLGTGLILWASAIYGLSVKPFQREVYSP